MCGATGEVRLDGQPHDIGAVSAMAEAMATRGPDAAGVWSQGRVALGHRRLKIIDLSEAAPADGRRVQDTPGDPPAPRRGRVGAR